MLLSALQNAMIRPILAAALGHDSINDVLVAGVIYDSNEITVDGAHAQTGFVVCQADRHEIGGHIKVPFICRTSAAHTSGVHAFEPISYVLNLGSSDDSMTIDQRRLATYMARALQSCRLTVASVGYTLD